MISTSATFFATNVDAVEKSRLVDETSAPDRKITANITPAAIPKKLRSLITSSLKKFFVLTSLGVEFKPQLNLAVHQFANLSNDSPPLWITMRLNDYINRIT